MITTSRLQQHDPTALLEPLFLNAMGSDRSLEPFHPRSPAFSLARCLSAVGMPGATAEPLAGGLINYVWRVIDQNSQTQILKHAEGVSKYNESRKSSAERLVYEVRALQMPVLRAASEKVPSICVPEIKVFDRELYALLMTDGGGRSVADVYQDGDNGDVDFRDLGVRLGRWIAVLHNATRNAEAGDFENPISEQAWASAGPHMPDRMEQYGYARRDGEIVRDEYFGIKADEPACCVHGDFRPNNMLLTARNDVMIIDWEMSKRQSPAADLSLFAAHSHILETVHGERGLLQGFLTTYRVETGSLVDERVALRTAVEFGSFLAYWAPRMGNLGDEAQTARFAAVGAEMMHKAVRRDFEWLRQSCLRVLFET
jgi:aminoglycoside phosphotransferase (APT) family kinase protein